MEKYKVKVIFYKKDFAVYLSQLDLVRVFERALRRTNLAVLFTQGFRPHLKLSFLSRALKVGEEGKIEVVFYFSEKIDTYLVKEKLEKELPPGLEIVDIQALNCDISEG